MPTQRKKRGAQTGNANAATHGVFSAHFTDDELTRIIDQITNPTSGIDAATEATYVLLDRIIARISPKAGDDDEVFLKLVTAHNETTGRIAQLARSRQVVSSDAAETLTGNIAAALDQLAGIMHADV